MSNDRIVFENVSKFYGEVLGVNGVSLSLAPGITSLVGPNGSGKTTLMNLMCGLIHPSRGRIEVLGETPANPERFFRNIGYCSQFDTFPRGVTGYEFVRDTLLFAGYERAQAAQLAADAIARVNLTEAGKRKVAGYSKGMRQRIRLAQSLAHQPRVLILDEPLNGLDPMARAESLALFRSLADQGMHVILSSHILHEVERISDCVVLLSSGYVVAEGGLQGMRDEVTEHPLQVLVKCAAHSNGHGARALAARMIATGHVLEARVVQDGTLMRTTDPSAFYLELNRLVVEDGIAVETVAPADADANSVYQYLIGTEGPVV